MPSRFSLAVAVATLCLAGAAPADAQVRIRYGNRTGWMPNPYREGLPTAENGVVDRGFSFCRLLYRSVTSEQRGHGWNTDYPDSDHNFTVRFEELTPIHAARWADGEPGYAVVRPTQPELYECPFLFMSDAGTVGFSDVDVANLREYLLKGGMIWADDFWGERAWRRFSSEIARIVPEYAMIDIPPDHEIMTTLYLVDSVPQVPSIQFWRRTRFSTSEMGQESETPHLRGVFDESGRPLVLATHNTDIGDGWEREGEDVDFFYTFSPKSYALGINIMLYMMSH
ncbi:MAG: DUF4159 domain-containing protein [Gemmatimonadota bacterium]|jgi:hypothetical protein